MPAPTTYSFLDVNAAITGPGGSFSIGNGAGPSDEGISVAYAEEPDGMTIGADGSGMHSLRANKSGKITVRLLKVSPTNAQLMAMVNFQRAGAASWGQNTLSIVNKNSGDAITAQQCAFSKIPDINYAKDGDILVWEFNAILIDIGLGAGVQA